MAIVGRHLRRHRAMMSQGNTAEDAARRVRLRASGEQANREMMAKFAPLTAENASAAIAWQEARIAELTTAGSRR